MADVEIFDNGRRTQLLAAAGQTDFGFNFLIFEETDIDVFLTKPLAVPNLVADKLTLNVDYTVPVDGINNEAGGKIVLVVPATIFDVITIQSNTDKSQLVDFTVGGQFAPATVNFVIDKVTILIQETNSLITDLGLTYPTVDQLDKSADKNDNTLPVLPAQTGDTFPVWTKNTNNKLIAGVLKEEGNCSSLRGELADESVTTPGSQIVGFFNPNTTTSETIDATLKFLLNALLPVTTHTIGDIKPSFSIVASTGWIRMNDDTIGNLASGATARANADTEDLFVLLWNNISDAFAPVSGGRGATAIDDFNANKTLRFPLINGRVPGGAGTGAGLSVRTLGQSNIGEEDHLLIISEIPAHQHTVSAAGSVTRAGGGEASAIPSAGNVGATGGDGVHNNMQPTVFMNWYIRFIT